MKRDLRPGEADPTGSTPARPGRAYSVRGIQAVVATHYNVTVEDILSSNQAPAIRRARGVAMLLARTNTTKSLQVLARLFARSHHTAIHHAVMKLRSQMAVDSVLAREVAAISAKLTAA